MADQLINRNKGIGIDRQRRSSGDKIDKFDKVSHGEVKTL